jgi:hypothetical protein
MVNHTAPIIAGKVRQNEAQGMMPATEEGAGSGRKRRPRRARRETGGAEPPVGRVLQLVAALKAEQVAGSPLSLASDAAERVKLLEWLRRFLALREEERGGWEGRVRDLEAELSAAREIAATALSAAEQSAAQHDRLITDLKLMHEHQRSIWQLERRQLQIALEAMQRTRRRSLLRHVVRLARPAVAAALMLAALMASAQSAMHPAPINSDAGGGAAGRVSSEG